MSFGTLALIGLCGFAGPLLSAAGHGAVPEDLAIHDHRLQIYGAAWIALFAVGIYG